jgi:uncharacterized protein
MFDFKLFRGLERRRGRVARLLAAQVDHALDGLAVIAAAVRRETTPERCLERLIEIEHDGDDVRGAVVEELASALILPLDREDLFRVSRSVDDVLDNLRDFARELALFELQDVRCVSAMVDELEQALTHLRAAVTGIPDEDESFPRAVLAAKKASNGVRSRYDEALAGLFEDPVDADTMKQRELLRRLDVVGLRLGEAGDALADGAVKRAH